MPRERSRKKSPGKPSHRPPRRAGPAAGGLPSKEEILEYLQGAPAATGKREIARAFSVKGSDRIAFKRLLAEMTEEGLLVGNRKRLKERGQLPAVTVLDIGEPDEEGELTARPASWDGDEGPPPAIRVVEVPARRADLPPLGPGDRILANLTRVTEPEAYAYIAKPIKKLARERHRLLGIFRAHARGGGVIAPVDRRDLKEWAVQSIDQGDAKDGDLVRYEIVAPRHSPRARITEVIGNPSDQRQISLIAVHAHGIPEHFSATALQEVEALATPDLDARTDLRSVPLVTIDPPDARDHDDAVHAAPDTDPKNEGGWIVTVAIADVACYVRPGTRLDAEAQRRGNSVYFPDRVVPMLPERISNDLCSLREAEERPCLAVRMIFDKHGDKRGHTFLRAAMKSTAKLSYEQAQAAIDGKPDEKTGPLLEPVLRPLWAAYDTLAKARDRRGPLDLNLPERKILLDKTGHVDRVVVPERLTAHRLIEEFMIQANVAAAEQLEAKRSPVVYRVHAEPSREKLVALADFLETLDLPAPKAGTVRSDHFNRILARAEGQPYAELVNEVILRSQAQAEYAPQNVGHFGLNLRRYAHFTSPIRRYADLLVHRSLISALGLGPDGLGPAGQVNLAQVCETISMTERRAMSAERETIDRLVAAFLSDRVGAKFQARVSGVTRTGLFVKLLETGADGYVPAATLGEEYFVYDEDNHLLIGERTREAYRLGDKVEVRLLEAIPSAGALRFEVLTPGTRLPGALALRKQRRFGAPRRPPRGRRR